jgi:hypothetical protein
MLTHCVSFYNFGDVRLWGRFLLIKEEISKNMNSVITRCFTKKRDRAGAYRFFSNDKVTPESILLTHQPVLQERLKNCSHDILMIQDSSTLSYSSHPCTKNLGRIGCHKTPGYGLITHNSLAIDAETNTSLGLAHQSYFYHNEAQKESTRRIEDKESYRWIEHLRHNTALCPTAIHICDREGDIFEFLLEAERLQAKVIVRQSQDRALGLTMYGTKEGLLSDRLSAAAFIGSYDETLQDELVTLSLKFVNVTIAPPIRSCEQRGDWDYKAISLTVVQVSGTKSNAEPISWSLLTTMPVYDLASAQKIVRYYAKRWHIELFHKAMKTGFSLEEARLQEGEKIKKLVALVSIEAVQVYRMLYAARQEVPASPNDFLQQEEVQIITLLMKKTHPPSLKDIVEFIGTKGGFSKTKNYPHPGILTFFRGWNIVIHQINALKDVWNR